MALQWRCSSSKTFSSRSILTAKHSSKWPFYQEPRMALHGRPKKRLLEQRCSSSVGFQIKRPRVVPMPMAVKETEVCMERKWNEMDHDILVTIMKCLVQESYSVPALFTLYRAFLVC